MFHGAQGLNPGLLDKKALPYWHLLTATPELLGPFFEKSI
jgi:hypothetical protein